MIFVLPLRNLFASYLFYVSFAIPEKIETAKVKWIFTVKLFVFPVTKDSTDYYTVTVGLVC